jgi:hypothetical protein
MAPRKLKVAAVQDEAEAVEAVEMLPVPAGYIALFHDAAASCSVPGAVISVNNDGSFHVPAEYVATLVESHGFKVEG